MSDFFLAILCTDGSPPIETTSAEERAVRRALTARLQFFDDGWVSPAGARSDAAEYDDIVSMLTKMNGVR